MIELFGIELGTVFQGGTLAAILALLAVVLRTYIVGMPERARVALEGKTIATGEASERYRAWRVEVHELKTEVAKVSARQYLTDKQLSEALAVNRHNEVQMRTMLFLIRLLISELKRLDPQSAIVKQAELTLEQMDEGRDPGKSDALNTAETAVQDAKQTLASTKDTCEEVKRSEGGGE